MSGMFGGVSQISRDELSLLELKIAKQIARLQLVSGVVLPISCLQIVTRGQEAHDALLFFLLGLLVNPILLGSFALPLLCSIVSLRTDTVWIRALLSASMLASSYGALVVMGAIIEPWPREPQIWFWGYRYSALVLAGASMIQVLLALFGSIKLRDTVSTVLSGIAAAVVIFFLAFWLRAVYGTSVEVVEHSRLPIIIEKSARDIEIAEPLCRQKDEPIRITQSGVPLPLCDE